MGAFVIDHVHLLERAGGALHLVSLMLCVQY